ncbi:hypothetical protein J2753_002438 [Halolamina salifodinae]|uniref:Aminoacyl-transfer RNA synthetases class-II family profile domain-containing protein n=1 Tax=Halolamina salifodinae TaxID=1202767 RepID=A0A8T4H432_9EURY|nr:hypothetical protein [Halolamina salifodinae]
MQNRTYTGDVDAGEAATVAGWGMGAERLVMTMLDLDNIREAVLFLHDRQRLRPVGQNHQPRTALKTVPTATAYSASASTGSASPSSSSDA